MTKKRSYRHFVLGSLGVALLLSNCTIKEDTDESCKKGDKVNGCECPGGVTGHQVCGSNGVFGACMCPGGSAGSGNTSGTSTGGGGEDVGGAPNGGSGGTGGTSAGAAGAPEGGMDGAGGEPFAFIDCDECVATLCEAELDECLLADDDGLCVDQYSAVMACVDAERAMGNNVTRDLLRGCGVTLGASSNADLAADWAPPLMTDETTNLINCLATSSSELPDGEWANVDGPNFPDDAPPTPWPADSCAKLACTSPQ